MPVDVIPDFLSGGMPTFFSGVRSGDGDATNGANRHRGLRQDHPERSAASEDDDNEDSKADSDGIRRGPLSSASDRPKGHATSDRKVTRR